MTPTPHTLLAWISDADLEPASLAGPEAPLHTCGPIAAAVKARAVDAVVLLAAADDARVDDYARWLAQRARVAVRVRPSPVGHPDDHAAFLRHAREAVDETLAAAGTAVPLTFHLGAGPSSSSAAWILLARTRLRAALVQWTPARGVEEVDVPLEVSPELVREYLCARESALARSLHVPEAPGFADVVHEDAAMARAVERARAAATNALPVLITGEPGTGKELLARAIHAASLRAPGPFLVVPCGAIPENLLEAETFGFVKGSFTGAVYPHPGAFERAHGGTIYFDALDDLPPTFQVKLLRAIERGEAQRIGESKPRRFEVRVIASTKPDPLAEVAAGRLRSDLYYGLAGLTVRVPALRDRGRDAALLATRFVERLAATQPEAPPRSLSRGAKDALCAHDWPGNVRELAAVVQRAWAATRGATIGARCVASALRDGVA